MGEIQVLPIRRAPNLQSPLALVPLDKLFPSDEDEISAEKGRAPLEKQRHPGPDHPQWKILRNEWPAILRQVVQEETYRQADSKPLWSVI